MFTGDTNQEQEKGYSKEGPYVGRTAGWGTPESVLKKRLLAHHVYPRSKALPISVFYETRTSASPNERLRQAMRGREQQWIDHFGGPRPKGGKTLNLINGIRETNPMKGTYMKAADRIYGQ